MSLISEGEERVFLESFLPLVFKSSYLVFEAVGRS